MWNTEVRKYSIWLVFMRVDTSIIRQVFRLLINRPCVIFAWKREREFFINFSHIDWLSYSVGALTLALANWREVFTFSFLHHATHFRGRFLPWRWMESAALHPPSLLLSFYLIRCCWIRCRWTELSWNIGWSSTCPWCRQRPYSGPHWPNLLYFIIFLKFVYLQPSCTSILNKRLLGKV